MPRELAQLSDADLFALMCPEAKENHRAFSILYDRHAPSIYRYCRRVLGDGPLADDVFQETFARFYASAADARTMTNVHGFLIRIARNLCLNAKGSKHYRLSSIDDLDLVSHGRAYENDELLELLRATIATLPEDYREAFVLREYDGLSYREIAELLDISLNNVRVRIHRARTMLRMQLAPYIADL